MKKIYFALAIVAAMFLSACNKQENEGPAQDKVAKTFFGATEQTDTKTVLSDDLKVYWEEGNIVMIQGSTDKFAQDFQAVPDKENPTKATFTGYLPMPELLTPPYKAYYPSEIWSNKLFQSSLPEVQHYKESFDAPMYAESDDENFQFHNICGVLHFALKGKHSSISQIKVEAVDEVVCGMFSVSNGKNIEMAKSSANSVILAFSSDVQLNSETATDFYIYLPPQTYKAGMTITINNSQTTKFVKTTTKDFVVERNTVYTFNWDVTPKSGTTKGKINGKEVDIPWVELWENGPKFAKYNLGVTDGKESSYGGYYDQKNAYGFSDRVPGVWGDNWRTPSKSELQGILANCTFAGDTVDGIEGVRYTGKGAYRANSIFLPYAGFYDYVRESIVDKGTVGKYISSTDTGGSSAMHYHSLIQRGGGGWIESDSYDDKLSIRPVVVE